MPRLYHTQTGQPLEVAHEDVSAILAVGDYGLSKDVVVDGEVELISKEGDIVRVDTNRVHDALAEGYQLESDSSRDWREEKKRYEGFAPALGAFSLGALEGATLGLSTVGIEALGIADVGKYEEHRPGAFGAGELSGTVASLAIPGAPVAKEAAFARSMGVELAKKAAKKSGEAGVGKGLMQKALSGGVEGAIDSSMFMAGDQAAEWSKGNAPLTGQALVAGFGAGVGLGAAINILGPASFLALKKTPKALGLVRTPVVDQSAEELFSEIAGEAAISSLGRGKKFATERLRREQRSPGYIKGLGAFISTGTVKIGDDEKLLVEAFDSWEEVFKKVKAKRDDIGGQLGGFYRSLDSLGADTPGIDIDEIVKKIKTIKVPTVGGDAVITAKDNAIYDAYRMVIKNDLKRSPGDPAIQERLMHLYDELDKIPGAKITEIAEGGVVTDEHLDKALKTIGAGRIEDFWGSYKKVADQQSGPLRGVKKLDFEDAVAHKGAHYYEGRFNKGIDKPIQTLHQDVGLMWRDGIEDAAKKITSDKTILEKLDIPNFDEFKELNKQYGFIADAYNTSFDKVAANAVNRVFSLSDYQAGIAGAVTGASRADPISAMILGAIGGIVNKGFRERGQTLLTAGARNAAKMAAKRNKVIDDIDMVPGAFMKIEPVKLERRLAIPLTAKAISAFTVTGEPVRGETKKEKMNSFLDQVREANDDPSTVVDRIEEQVASIRPIAPNIADEMVLTATNKIKFLGEKAPKRRESYNKLQPYVYDDAYLNAEDMAKFERFLLATVDPMGALLGEINTGSVSSETVESIKRIYPAMLDEIRMKMTETISDSDQQLPAYKMSEIAKLFEQSMVKYQDPGFIQRQQAQYKKKVKQGALGGLKKSSARVGVMQEMAQTGPQSVISNLRRG